MAFCCDCFQPLERRDPNAASAEGVLDFNYEFQPVQSNPSRDSALLFRKRSPCPERCPVLRFGPCTGDFEQVPPNGREPA